MAEREREYLGPMARSIVETFAGLTLPQQRQVFALVREVLEENERLAEMMERLKREGLPPEGDG